ncbi:thiamine pyrophosphokinase [Williamsoniiplasma luminosum]|uniref:Thiamine diphosphokinase n=1 Tax=Williamsoniiplasma luminosum TaxID=214888 RepID=A0A2K8NWG5_9MOLU|nr:thiamine diphosphokinase [Williamsoniiplasma luminosum]ATZ17081.1 thiamine pyrophosphokinase [Williamsoniiplasma luminosum]
MKPNIFIVAAKTKLNYKKILSTFPNTIFIGVERGALDLIHKGIKPNLCIGDFDKVTKEELKLIKNSCDKFELHNREKEFLDGEIAILEALKLEHTKIFFVVKPTKRYDKNISIMDLVFKYNVEVLNDETVILKIKKGFTTLDFNLYQDITYISFYAKNKATIALNNFKYDIENLTLDAYENKAISNEFISYKNSTIMTNKELVCILSKNSD